MKRSMDKLLEKGRDKELTKEELSAAQVVKLLYNPQELNAIILYISFLLEWEEN